MKYVIKRISSTSTTESIEETVRLLEECYSSVDGVIEPRTISLIGKASAGKTRALAEFCSRHPKIRTPDGLIAPIVRVNAPFRTRPIWLADLMLQELESSQSLTRISECSQTAQLCSLIRRARTRMVVIDDLHHFYIAKTRGVPDRVADWLRALVSQCRVGLVVASRSLSINADPKP